MPLWKCNACGYEMPGNCRPRECPQCKGPKDGFLKAGTDGAIKKKPDPKKVQKKVVKAKAKK
jgi:rubredoxin